MQYDSIKVMKNNEAQLKKESIRNRVSGCSKLVLSLFLISLPLGCSKGKKSLPQYNGGSYDSIHNQGIPPVRGNLRVLHNQFSLSPFMPKQLSGYFSKQFTAE